MHSPPLNWSRSILSVIGSLSICVILFELWHTRIVSHSFPSFISVSNAPHSAKNYAYITFFGPHFQGKGRIEGNDDNEDTYFIAARILAYQFLHDPMTRSQNSYPFIVMTTTEVSESKRERLRQDGAQVITVERLDLDWQDTQDVWRDVLTKLRLFELVQYDKLAFLDADTLLTRPMDDIFDDIAATEQGNLGIEEIKSDEAPQPKTYVFAGNEGANVFNKTYPPQQPGIHLNSGCMVLKPSKELFEHYLSITKLESRYNGRYPEQGLWGYVHRQDGNMPWKQLDWKWNTKFVIWEDYLHGIASLHMKWWWADTGTDLGDWARTASGGRWKVSGPQVDIIV